MAAIAEAAKASAISNKNRLPYGAAMKEDYERLSRSCGDRRLSAFRRRWFVKGFRDRRVLPDRLFAGIERR